MKDGGSSYFVAASIDLGASTLNPIGTKYYFTRCGVATPLGLTYRSSRHRTKDKAPRQATAGEPPGRPFFTVVMEMLSTRVPAVTSTAESWHVGVYIYVYALVELQKGRQEHYF